MISRSSGDKTINLARELNSSQATAYMHHCGRSNCRLVRVFRSKEDFDKWNEERGNAGCRPCIRSRTEEQVRKDFGVGLKPRPAPNSTVIAGATGLLSVLTIVDNVQNQGQNQKSRRTAAGAAETAEPLVIESMELIVRVLLILLVMYNGYLLSNKIDQEGRGDEVDVESEPRRRAPRTKRFLVYATVATIGIATGAGLLITTIDRLRPKRVSYPNDEMAATVMSVLQNDPPSNFIELGEGAETSDERLGISKEVLSGLKIHHPRELNVEIESLDPIKGGGFSPIIQKTGSLSVSVTLKSNYHPALQYIGCTDKETYFEQPKAYIGEESGADIKKLVAAAIAKGKTYIAIARTSEKVGHSFVFNKLNTEMLIQPDAGCLLKCPNRGRGPKYCGCGDSLCPSYSEWVKTPKGLTVTLTDNLRRWSVYKVYNASARASVSLPQQKVVVASKLIRKAYLGCLKGENYISDPNPIYLSINEPDIFKRLYKAATIAKVHGKKYWALASINEALSHVFLFNQQYLKWGKVHDFECSCSWKGFQNIQSGCSDALCGTLMSSPAPRRRWAVYDTELFPKTSRFYSVLQKDKIGKKEVALEYLGCTGTDHHFPKEKEYIGESAGANLLELVSHAVSSRKSMKFVAIARDSDGSGHAFIFNNPSRDPWLKTEAGCRLQCKDVPSESCGCADNYCPNGVEKVNGAEHKRRWAVYRIW